MNIHSIGDRRQPQSDRRLQQQINNPQNLEDNGLPWGAYDPALDHEYIKYAEQNRVLLVSGSRRVKNPREQNYVDMLISTFCPTFKCLSLTILLVIADIVMFIVQLSLGLNKQGVLLEVQSETLLQLGANYGPKVASGQVYRLISAIFLHINFIHILGNLLSTFILVTRIQYTYGFLRALVIYILCGIGGNIFSLAVSHDSNYTTVKAGASTALFGMIGLLIGYLILNWRGLYNIGQNLRCSLICSVIFLLIFVLIFTPSTSNNSVDYYGHLGGFLTGIWMAAIGQTLINQTRQKVIKSIFVLLFIVQFAATFASFFVKY